MALKPESIEKIKAWIAKDGARIAGKKLIDQWLNKKIGLTSSDLADTATFASGLDDIESLLDQGEFDEAFMVAKDTAEGMLEDEGMDGGMFENADHGVSEIYTAIKDLVDRDGVKQAAYNLLDIALKKINDQKGMYFVPKSRLTDELLASLEQLLNQKRYDEAYLISASHAKRIKRQIIDSGNDMSMNMREHIRLVIRSFLLEEKVAISEDLGKSNDYYLIDNEGYYSIPDIDSLLDTLEEKNQLPMFYKMHYVNLSATEAKKEMQDLGIDQYDYPEGIEFVIQGGKSFLKALSQRIKAVYGDGAIDQLNKIIHNHSNDIPMGQ